MRSPIIIWSMHPGKGDLQTMAPLRAGTSYVYESGAPQTAAPEEIDPHVKRTRPQQDTTAAARSSFRTRWHQAAGRRQAPAESIAYIDWIALRRTKRCGSRGMRP